MMRILLTVCSDYPLSGIKWIYTLSGIILLTACNHDRIEVNPPPPPARYLTCADQPETPKLEPLAPFALPNGILVYDKRQTDERDSAIARYIVALRAAWGDCSNQLGRVRDYVEGVE